MKDEAKTKEQLVAELVELRQRVAELEASDAERKRAEEALGESEQKYRFITEKMTDAVWLMDMELKPTFISPSVTRTLGYTLEELQALSLNELLTPKSFEFAMQTIAIELAPERLAPRLYERPVTVELEFRRKDGSPLCIESTITLLRDSEGRPTGLMGVGRDITERKQAKEALQKSEERLRKLSEASWEAIAIHDQGILLLANDQFFEMFGYEPDELLKKPAIEETLTPESLADVMEKFKSGDLGPYEAIGMRKDGTEFTLEVRVKMMEYHDKMVRVAAMRDITERKQAEEALRESEEKYRLVSENIPVAVYSALPDEHSTNLFMSGRTEELTGYSVQQFLEDPDLWTNILHPEDVEYIWQKVREHRENKSLLDIEYRIITKDKKVRWLRDKATPAFDENGNIVRIDGFMEDITERKQAEEALRESEAHLRNLSDNLPGGMTYQLDMGVDGQMRQFTYVSAGVEKMHEVTAEAVLQDAQLLYGQIIEADRPLVAAQEAQAQAAMTTFSAEARFRLPSGATRWSLLTSAPRQAPNGHLIWDGIEIDITERKQAEEERERLLIQIQEQARQMRQIMDTVPEGVLVLNTDGQITLANPMAGQHLDTLAGAQVGGTLTHLGNHPLAEFLTSPPKGLWHEVTMGDRVFELIARPMENGPKPEDWVLVINDVTQQREIQQHIQHQERLASVGQLAAGIAHDFNNIMATIVLYAQTTARMEELPSVVRERMATINQQAGHAAKLIQQILDFSRRAVLERQPLDLALLLKDHVRLLKRTLPESIEVKLTLESGEHMVHADPTRMQQVVTNLAVNARDAMPGGGTLHVGLERIEVKPRESPLLPEMEPGEWVQVTISDTGTGIPPDVLPHIFEPFFTTKAPAGSGLGLSQVHGIVGQHGGRIDVESQVGEGTTFTIYLPALLASPSKPSGVSALGELPELPTGREETVLVVEDNAVVRKALVESLELLNYRVLEAVNGQEALAILEQRSDDIDLLLSDVVMPGMGGVALLHALKERGLAVKVVMITGHLLEKELDELRAQGMADWLHKPPELEKLAEVVARVLGMD